MSQWRHFWGDQFVGQHWDLFHRKSGDAETTLLELGDKEPSASSEENSGIFFRIGIFGVGVVRWDRGRPNHAHGTLRARGGQLCVLGPQGLISLNFAKRFCRCNFNTTHTAKSKQPVNEGSPNKLWAKRAHQKGAAVKKYLITTAGDHPSMTSRSHKQFLTSPPPIVKT